MAALHPHFGRAYIILMMRLMASSLVLHNTWLPIAALISFLCVLGSITFGWMCIEWHQAKMDLMVFALLSTKKGVTEKSFHEARMAIADQKNWLDRLFSAKAAHGGMGC